METLINIIGSVVKFLFTIAKIILAFWVIVGGFALGVMFPALGFICLAIVVLWVISR